MAGPLSDITVIELAKDVSGAYCAKLLAALGATVIKVEPPGGDPGRRRGPFAQDRPHPETSLPFLHLNTDKESITLNIGRASGRLLLGGLLRDADVLVESFPPGYLASLELGHDWLFTLNPRLILTSVTYCGQTGPYALFRGSEIVVYALGGYLLVTGDRDKPPLKAYGHQGEYQAGLQAALGTMVALSYREARGQGQQVDVSAMEAVSFLLGGPPQIYYFEGDIPKRNGNRLVGFGPRMGYPSTIRPCRDGWVHVHTNYRHPELLATLIGDDWLADRQMLGEAYAHADEMDAVIDRWLAARDKWEAAAAAQELRLPFTEVLSPAEVIEDRHGHHHARRSFQELDHPAAGRLLQPGPPVRLLDEGESTFEMRRAPLVGEHNVEVYCQRLGLSRRQLPWLRAAGVV